MREFPNYLISKKASIFNKHTQREAVPFIKEGRLVVKLQAMDRKWRVRSVARIMANQFWSIDTYPQFKDGDCRNCSYDNLLVNTKKKRKKKIPPHGHQLPGYFFTNDNERKKKRAMEF